MIRNFNNFNNFNNMTTTQQIALLKDKHFAAWVTTRQQVFNELSDKQGMFCMCGKLATGMHEQNCSRFNKQVDKTTLSRLKHLI